MIPVIWWPACPDPAAVAWVRRGEGLVGWGEAARVTVPAGEDRFTAGEKWLRELFDSADVTDEVGVPGSGPVAFGSFTFDPTSDGSVFVVPRGLLGRSAGRAWLTTIGEQHEPPAPAPLPALPAEVSWHDGSLTALQWERAVAAAVARIQAGDLRKAVLARDLYADASEDIDVRVLLARLAERYPDCWTFSCAGLAGATPELLIRREGTQVSSLVLAGTTPRGRSQAEDEALGTVLLASAKDVEEHQYAVADVRATLDAALRSARHRREALAAAAGQRPAPGDPCDRTARPAAGTARRRRRALAGTSRRSRLPPRCTPPPRCAAPRPAPPWS